MGMKPAIGGREVLFEWVSWRVLRRWVMIAARVVFPGGLLARDAEMGYDKGGGGWL